LYITAPNRNAVLGTAAEGALAGPVAADGKRDMTQQPTTTRRRSLVGALILLTPAAVLAGAWRLGGVSALEDDLIYYLPIRQYIGECLRSGELPLWNPWVAMGTSIAADPQSGLWYPPTALFALLPPLWAYPTTIVLHFALAGAGMYRFLRASRHPWPVALFGALAFEFSGFLVAHRVHLTMLQAAAWLPWLLYAWSRFARSGAFRHFALAAACLGVQMLVQHVQVSIISVALVSGYVLAVLLPHTRSLLWQYPVGSALGLALSSIQTLPTWLHYAGTARGTPAYHLFIENSWSPTSALLLLFPMLFGSRTPNLWSQPWWGISHYCEQAAYASLLVLIFAGASLALLTRPTATARRGEVLFWWIAMVVALLLALGQLTPLSRLLFHVPIYQSLRVPARWILVWSVALPILACITLTAAIRDELAAVRIRRAIRLFATRILPGSFAAASLLLIAARLLSGPLSAHLTGYRATEFWEGLVAAVRPGNPALWWPLLLMAATAYAVTAWLRSLTAPPVRPREHQQAPSASEHQRAPSASEHQRAPSASERGAPTAETPSTSQEHHWHTEHAPRMKKEPNASLPSRCWILCAVLLLDLAGVAAFIDVDTDTYRQDDLRQAPPLAEAIKALKPQPGDRLLVPRPAADYNRPIELLWPQTNIPHRIATFQGYGPFWPVANRLLLRFMPWGSSEEILALLNRPDLCRAFGIRFLAVRSPEERTALARSSRWLAGDRRHENPPQEAAFAPDRRLAAGDDLLWPVQVDEQGLYALSLHAAPGPTPAHRWFVRIETPDAAALTDTRTIEPVDLALGPREIRFLFACEQAPGPAQIRIKAERGEPVHISRASFALVAADAETGKPTHPTFQHRHDLPGDIALHELPSPLPWAYWADHVGVVPTLLDAVSHLQKSPASDTPPPTIIESPADLGDLSAKAERTVIWSRPTGHNVVLTAENSRPGLLVVNESFDAGWRAEINGKAVPIRRVNAIVQGLVLTAGRHTITLRYQPRGLNAGIFASCMVGSVLLVGLTGSLARLAMRKKDRPGMESAALGRSVGD